MTESDVWLHINEHDVDFRTDEDFDISGRIQRIIRVLEDHVDFIIESFAIDHGTIKSLTSLASELRKALMDYAELQGKIQRGNVVVQVNQYQQQLNILVQTIIEDLCDECRERVASKFA